MLDHVFFGSMYDGTWYLPSVFPFLLLPRHREGDLPVLPRRNPNRDDILAFY